jgi:hypothetical protein
VAWAGPFVWFQPTPLAEPWLAGVDVLVAELVDVWLIGP